MSANHEAMIATRCVASPPILRCAASTGMTPGAYGLERVPCHATRGLTRIVAADGTTLAACPAFGHRSQVAAKAARMTKPSRYHVDCGGYLDGSGACSNADCGSWGGPGA